MRRRGSLFFMLILTAFGATGSAAIPDALRSWTPRDSVEIQYFITHPQTPPGSLGIPTPNDQPIVPSPSGQHFFFLSYRGDLAGDQVIYELRVFSVDALKKTIGNEDPAGVAAPLRHLKFASAVRDEDPYAAAGIAMPFWESNSTIVFAGVQGKGPHRLYRLDIGTGRLYTLSAEPEVFVSFGAGPGSTYAVRGDSALYLSVDLVPWAPLHEYPMAPILGDALFQMMYPYKSVAKIYATRRGGATHFIAEGKSHTGIFIPRISPDEKWAVVVFARKDKFIPTAWRQYEVPSKMGYQFFLVEMSTGRWREIMDAPTGAVTHAGRDRVPSLDAFWSADSRHVLLFNTALPLNNSAVERRRMSYIVDYMPESGQWSVIEPMVNPRGNRVESAAWVQEGTEVLVTYESTERVNGEATLYRYNGEAWERRSTSKPAEASKATGPTLPADFKVELRETMNTPPVMWASHGDRQIALTGPDKALNGVWRASVQTNDFRMDDGRHVAGLLMLPRDHAKSKPLPLIIQAESLVSDRAFRPDGQISSNFAAQALVAQGFAVLQVEFSPGVHPTRGTEDPTRMTPQEGPYRVKMIDKTVEVLERQGLVDPTRVGIVGFSRTGYHTFYAITHPGKIKIGAAAIFDSLTASYGEYVIDAGFDDMSSAIFEKQYGEGTFWQNKNGWLDAPVFNVNKVVTPVLFAVTGTVNLTSPLETIGAFRYCRRPFEYLVFPKAGHQLVRPREREASMQATVDWMTFWLQGRENKLTADNRFIRWRQLRTDWEQTQAEEVATRANHRAKHLQTP